MSTPISTLDVLVVGAGVVGSALARDLTRYNLTVGLLEAGAEFGEGASKSNSALMCCGWDTPRHSQERTFVMRGYARYMEEGPALGLPVGRVGSIMIAWTAEQVETLREELRNAQEDNFTAEWLDAPALYQREPHLGPEALAGLYVPDECIVDPFSTVYAYVLDAVTNGALYMPSTPAHSFSRKDGLWHVETPGQSLQARFVVNCAGLQGDVVDAAAGYHEFTIRPRKGQFLVFDKQAAPLVHSILVPTPSSAGRGVLVIPTIFGNVMLGPTAEEVSDPFERSVTREVMEKLRASGQVILPGLEDCPLITTYAGVRPATEKSEYRITPRLEEGWLTVGGIRSTGLSAALGIAEYASGLVAEAMQAERKESIVPVRVPDLSAGRVPPWEDSTNPEDREFVCHCEKITLGAVKRALASPVPPVTLDGLRRRTRAGYGRCQGFFCGAKLEGLLLAARGVREIRGGK